jgi:hypothetical protein
MRPNVHCGQDGYDDGERRQDKFFARRIGIVFLSRDVCASTTSAPEAVMGRRGEWVEGYQDITDA